MTAEAMRSEFLSTLRSKNTLFDSLDDSNQILRLIWKCGDNLDEIVVLVNFATLDNGAMIVSVSNYDLPNFSDNLYAGYKACNQLNDDEHAKYYIDDEGDAVCRTVLLFNAYDLETEFSADQVLMVANVTALSVDDAYPILAEAAP